MTMSPKVFMKKMMAKENQPDSGSTSQHGSTQTAGHWSQYVTRHSNALDLEPGVFTWDDPAQMAASLTRSADVSRRRKGTPYRSAMSMLNFYINRAGNNLSERRRTVLEQAKDELARLMKT